MTTATNTCECNCSRVYGLAEDARNAVAQAYQAERSRYRSLELTRAAAALDALVAVADPHQARE